MSKLLPVINEKKRRLDTLRPLDTAHLKNLKEWFKIELTYTSNAIEGNTLTRQETALVIEKGLTVKGKSLVEHLEAVNHGEAVDYIHDLATRTTRQELTRRDLLSLHQLILHRVDDPNAGRYRDIQVSIAGTDVILPSPLKVPELMEEFLRWLVADHAEHIATIAAEAHYRLVSIHPFVDGNGRTARLLMNLLLVQEGYPPAIISNSWRDDYLTSLETAQITGNKQLFYDLIYRAISTSLDIYLNQDEKPLPASDKRLRIGELAAMVGESVVTIRHWTTPGLLEAARRTASGYRLYDPTMVKRARRIQELQKDRYSLTRIKQKLIRWIQ